MLDFDLAHPSTLDEAVQLLDTDDSRVRPISGGTALMLMMKSGVFEPSLLVDLTGVEAKHHAIETNAAGGLRIGAMATLSAIEYNLDVAHVAPVIPKIMKRLSNVRVRNVARLGGNLAHGDPHMDMPPILAALRAMAITKGPGGARRIPIQDLFAGYYETVLQQGELIAEIEIPPQKGWHTVYRKATVRAHDDWPTLGVAVSLRSDAGRLSAARVMVSAATEKLTAVQEAETRLVGQEPSEMLFREVAELTAQIVETISDAQGSAAYKKVLMAVELRRALISAAQEITT
jgi:aerobic carbon-monoxide dehydrogenase medium subunit